MRRKGLSQILWLIIAAAVLMMVALTLIFLAQGSLTDLSTGSNTQQCISIAETKCQTGAQSINVPSACLQEDGTTPLEGAPSWASGGGEVQCSTVLN